MKFTVDVKNVGEGEAVKRALEDSGMRAAVVAFGTLLGLPAANRHTALRYVLEMTDVPPGREDLRQPRLTLDDAPRHPLEESGT